MGGFTIQGVAHGIEIPQTTQRILDLEQWPIDVMTESAKDLFRTGAEVDHLCPCSEVDPIGLPQDRATASGKHAFVVERQVVDDSLFDVTKALLTFPFEVLPDRAAECFSIT
jgi:hypothetical protein